VVIQGKTKYTVDVADDATFRKVKDAITVSKFAHGIHVCSTGCLRACASLLGNLHLPRPARSA
jgi:hypothetical protein